jgi:uncharacterized secreted protein with C-terminal beta-propeller domain
MPVSGAAPQDAADTAQAAGAYSPTNVQVAGIDEGDIVKTDGHHLYVAHGRQVSIVSAGGADSTRVASIDTSALVGADELLVGPVVDLMIDGTTLIVVTHSFTAAIPDAQWHTPDWLSLAATGVKTAFYDIADPANPTLLSTVEQSGSYVDSRLSAGVLYLVSQYQVEPQSADPGDVGSYVPMIDDSTGARPVPADHCYLPPHPLSPTYSVATAIDVTSRKATSEVAVLGHTGTVYMSQANLYLASGQYWTTYEEDTANPAELTIPGSGGVYTGDRTTIARISLTAGDLAVAATNELAGSLLNQFALDETAGYLRAVTTWSDESTDWTPTPALWVLDSQLNVVGSIPQLTRDESVQSVRFDGAVAYVVTYRQVDPLFTLDLTDPADPKIQGALKIPGFSSYLHPFGDGLVLGVGVDETVEADDSVTRKGLKLSMFDASNPFDVRELASAAILADETEVSVDHKAMFVDLERGLIGLPTTTWGTEAAKATWNYRTYSWNGESFEPRAVIDLAADQLGATDSTTGWLTCRGTRIGDSFYLTTTSAVGVYSLTDFTRQATVTL